LKAALELKADVTGTFCRDCFQKWHRMVKGRALNEEAVDYVVVLIMG
jgi:hypothetical protein